MRRRNPELLIVDELPIHSNPELLIVNNPGRSGRRSKMARNKRRTVRRRRVARNGALKRKFKGKYYTWKGFVAKYASWARKKTGHKTKRIFKTAARAWKSLPAYHYTGNRYQKVCEGTPIRTKARRAARSRTKTKRKYTKKRRVIKARRPKRVKRKKAANPRRRSRNWARRRRPFRRPKCPCCEKC